MPHLVFPEGFLWGASTSSYQIEGGNTMPTGSVGSGRTRRRVLRRWQLTLGTDSERTWTSRPHSDTASTGSPPSGPGSSRPPASSTRKRSPTTRSGSPTPRSRGMQTVLVLWHFTNPAWLTERGAWACDEAPAHFETFVRRVVPELAAFVDWWATLNEANTYARHGWLTGEWPPGQAQRRRGRLRGLRGPCRGRTGARTGPSRSCAVPMHASGSRT